MSDKVHAVLQNIYNLYKKTSQRLLHNVCVIVHPLSSFFLFKILISVFSFKYILTFSAIVQKQGNKGKQF